MTHLRQRTGAFAGLAVIGGVLAICLTSCVSPPTDMPAATPTSPLAPISQPPLTNQEAALQDLRGCLAVNDVLNVFYLLDDSGSLATTDPSNLRQGILANSLASLSRLAPDEKVNWAAGSFKNEFSLLADWSPLDSAEDAQRLADSIPPTDDGLTNWKAGVVGAQESLASQSAMSPGCSLLIWFTDGEIYLEDGPGGPITTAAFESLCTGGPREPGLLQQLRERQVVVFGVLLNETDGADAAEQLTRVVEGSSRAVDGALQTCATLSSTDVRGTVQVVREVGDLAEVFDQLPLLLAGGSLGDIDADTGAFQIPLGVSRFVIRFGQRSQPWTLMAPDGSYIVQGDLDGTTGLRITEDSSGPNASVEVILDQAYQPSRFNGDWAVVDHIPGTDSLFRFSDLQVQVENDRLSGASLGLVSGERSSITGAILDRNGQPANLDLYEFDWVVQQRLPGESLARELSSETSDDGRSQFTISLGDTMAMPGDKPTVDVILRNLRTVDGQVPLEGPIASVRLTVVDPSQVPSGLMIRFLTPGSSATDPATGEIVAQPPSDGGSVAVVVRDSAPFTVSDRFDREFLVQGGSAMCPPSVTVCGHLGPEQSAVPIKIGIAPGERLHYSTVKGELLVELEIPPDGVNSDQPVRVISPESFSFETERPINLALLSGLLVALLIVGLTIPFGLAWALKRILVSLQHGRLLQRGEFPVVIEGGELTLSGFDISDEAGVSSAFRNLPPNDRVKTHLDPRLGTLAVRVPLNPLDPAWFSLVPPVGTRVIAKLNGVVPRKSAREINEGTLVATNGVLAATWGVAIQEQDLRAQETGKGVEGTLVVYMQPVVGESGQYTKRLIEIASTTNWEARLRDLTNAVGQSGSERRGKSSAQETRETSLGRPGRAESAIPSASQNPLDVSRPPSRTIPASQASGSEPSSPPARRIGSHPSSTPPRPPGR